jgi:hypothetical protein
MAWVQIAPRVKVKTQVYNAHASIIIGLPNDLVCTRIFFAYVPRGRPKRMKTS